MGGGGRAKARRELLLTPYDLNQTRNLEEEPILRAVLPQLMRFLRNLFGTQTKTRVFKLVIEALLTPSILKPPTCQQAGLPR